MKLMQLMNVKNNKGFTLVELMIAVAILALISTGAVMATHRYQLVGLSELQRGQALLLLEYQADCLSSGRSPTPAVMDRLQAALPGAALSEEQSTGGVSTLSVRWADPTGSTATRSLVVFAREAQ